MAIGEVGYRGPGYLPPTGEEHERRVPAERDEGRRPVGRSEAPDGEAAARRGRGSRRVVGIEPPAITPGVIPPSVPGAGSQLITLSIGESPLAFVRMLQRDPQTASLFGDLSDSEILLFLVRQSRLHPGQAGQLSFTLEELHTYRQAAMAHREQTLERYGVFTIDPNLSVEQNVAQLLTQPNVVRILQRIESPEQRQAFLQEYVASTLNGLQRASDHGVDLTRPLPIPGVALNTAITQSRVARTFVEGTRPHDEVTGGFLGLFRRAREQDVPHGTSGDIERAPGTDGDRSSEDVGGVHGTNALGPGPDPNLRQLTLQPGERLVDVLLRLAETDPDIARAIRQAGSVEELARQTIAISGAHPNLQGVQQDALLADGTAASELTLFVPIRLSGTHRDNVEDLTRAIKRGDRGYRLPNGMTLGELLDSLDLSFDPSEVEASSAAEPLDAEASDEALLLEARQLVQHGAALRRDTDTLAEAIRAQGHGQLLRLLQRERTTEAEQRRRENLQEVAERLESRLLRNLPEGRSEVPYTRPGGR